jgi:acyl-CoA thioesterase II
MDLVKDLAVEPIAGEELRFRALTLPKRMGNVGKFAYGGFQLGQCISAAFATVQRDHFCYSIFATFLGPGLLDELLDFKVEIVRTTRTFSTRRVEAFQLQNGERRKIMVLQLDCQAAEAGFVEFSAPPFHKYTHYDRLLDYPADLERKVEKGQLKRSLVDLYHKIFPLMKFAYHLRYCPESTGTQNMMGLLKGVESTQAHLPLTDRSTAVWSKAKERLANHAENVAAMTVSKTAVLASS